MKMFLEKQIMMRKKLWEKIKHRTRKKNSEVEKSSNKNFGRKTKKID